MISIVRSDFGTVSMYLRVVKVGPARIVRTIAGIAVQRSSSRTFSWNVAAGTPGFARNRRTATKRIISARMKKPPVSQTAFQKRSRTSCATGVTGSLIHARATPAIRRPARVAATRTKLRDGRRKRPVKLVRGLMGLGAPAAVGCFLPRAQGLGVIVELAERAAREV